jgi:hypothetical protein
MASFGQQHSLLAENAVGVKVGSCVDERVCPLTIQSAVLSLFGKYTASCDASHQYDYGGVFMEQHAGLLTREDTRGGPVQ